MGQYATFVTTCETLMSEISITDHIPALTIEIIWFDDDMVELRLAASSANFSGKTTCYASLDAPADFAERIEGFPRNASDTRGYEFGQANLSGYGGAIINLRCKDATGHLLAKISLYSTPTDRRSDPESAVVQLDVTPATIDAFVEELRKMRVHVGHRAILRGVT